MSLFYCWCHYTAKSVVVFLSWTKIFLIIKKRKKERTLCVFNCVVPYSLAWLLSNRSVVRNFFWIIPWEKLLWGKLLKKFLYFFVFTYQKKENIYVCVCVCVQFYFFFLQLCFKHFEVLAYQYMLQFSIYFNYMNLYAQGP